MKKFAVLFGLATIFTGILSGCGSGGSEEAKAPNGPPPEIAPSNNPERLKHSEGR